MSSLGADPPVLRVVHRRYVPHSDAHYGGGIVEGAYPLALFGDVATELSIRLDGDEGLLAGYEAVRFLAPIQAGDVVEITAELTGRGTRSRRVNFECRVVCRSQPAVSPSAAAVCSPPLLATTAIGTVVVPIAPAGT